ISSSSLELPPPPMPPPTHTLSLHDALPISQYRQAAATLSETTEWAAAEFGPTDSEVVELRLERANALFEGGNFRQAGPLYAELRSEEHTSELQARFDIVCRLLLARKKYIA